MGRSRRFSRIAKVGSSSDKNQDDTHHFRCRNCGFWCNRKTIKSAGPRPNADKYLDGIEYVTDSDGDYYPDVRRGCPLCGTLYPES
jgi:hypothetical protein